MLENKRSPRTVLLLFLHGLLQFQCYITAQITGEHTQAHTQTLI